MLAYWIFPCFKKNESDINLLLKPGKLFFEYLKTKLSSHQDSKTVATMNYEKKYFKVLEFVIKFYINYLHEYVFEKYSTWGWAD